MRQILTPGGAKKIGQHGKLKPTCPLVIRTGEYEDDAFDWFGVRGHRIVELGDVSEKAQERVKAGEVTSDLAAKILDVAERQHCDILVVYIHPGDHALPALASILETSQEDGGLLVARLYDGLPGASKFGDSIRSYRSKRKIDRDAYAYMVGQRLKDVAAIEDAQDELSKRLNLR